MDTGMFNIQFTRLNETYPNAYKAERLMLYFEWMVDIENINEMLPRAVDHFINCSRDYPLKQQFEEFFFTQRRRNETKV